MFSALFGTSEQVPVRRPVGLQNQGATCYLNSLLQSLFHLDCFREAVYSIPIDVPPPPAPVDLPNGIAPDAASPAAESPPENRKMTIVEALQRLFYRLETLQATLEAAAVKEAKSSVSFFALAPPPPTPAERRSRVSASTVELTRAFGWGADDVSIQQDVGEANRLLLDIISEKNKKLRRRDVIEEMFAFTVERYLRVVDVPPPQMARYPENVRVETMYELHVAVAGHATLESALAEHLKPERLDGSNRFKWEMPDGSTELHAIDIGRRFARLGAIFTVHLNRWEYDFEKDATVKVNTRCVFPRVLRPYAIRPPAPSGSTPTAAGGAGSAAAASGGPLAARARDARGRTDQRAVERALERETYDLYAVLIHSGTALQGHYYCFVALDPGGKSARQRQWMCFNDESVTPAEEGVVLQCGAGPSSGHQGPSAYMLVYVRSSSMRDVVFDAPRRALVRPPAHLVRMVRAEAAEAARRAATSRAMPHWICLHVATPGTLRAAALRSAGAAAVVDAYVAGMLRAGGGGGGGGGSGGSVAGSSVDLAGPSWEDPAGSGVAAGRAATPARRGVAAAAGEDARGGQAAAGGAVVGADTDGTDMFRGRAGGAVTVFVLRTWPLRLVKLAVAHALLAAAGRPVRRARPVIAPPPCPGDAAAALASPTGSAVNGGGAAAAAGSGGSKATRGQPPPALPPPMDAIAMAAAGGVVAPWAEDGGMPPDWSLAELSASDLDVLRAHGLRGPPAHWVLWRATPATLALPTSIGAPHATLGMVPFAPPPPDDLLWLEALPFPESIAPYVPGIRAVTPPPTPRPDPTTPPGAAGAGGGSAPRGGPASRSAPPAGRGGGGDRPTGAAGAANGAWGDGGTDGNGCPAGDDGAGRIPPFAPAPELSRASSCAYSSADGTGRFGSCVPSGAATLPAGYAAAPALACVIRPPPLDGGGVILPPPCALARRSSTPSEPTTTLPSDGDLASNGTHAHTTTQPVPTPAPSSVTHSTAPSGRHAAPPATPPADRRAALPPPEPGPAGPAGGFRAPMAVGVPYLHAVHGPFTATWRWIVPVRALPEAPAAPTDDRLKRFYSADFGGWGPLGSGGWAVGARVLAERRGSGAGLARRGPCARCGATLDVLCACGGGGGSGSGGTETGGADAAAALHGPDVGRPPQPPWVTNRFRFMFYDVARSRPNAPIGLFLAVCDPVQADPTWHCEVSFTLSLLSKEPSLTRRESARHVFTSNLRFKSIQAERQAQRVAQGMPPISRRDLPTYFADHGFADLAPSLSAILNPNNGFLWYMRPPAAGPGGGGFLNRLLGGSPKFPQARFACLVVEGTIRNVTLAHHLGLNPITGVPVRPPPPPPSTLGHPRADPVRDDAGSHEAGQGRASRATAGAPPPSPWYYFDPAALTTLAVAEDGSAPDGARLSTGTGSTLPSSISIPHPLATTLQITAATPTDPGPAGDGTTMADEAIGALDAAAALDAWVPGWAAAAVTAATPVLPLQAGPAGRGPPLAPDAYDDVPLYALIPMRWQSPAHGTMPRMAAVLTDASATRPGEPLLPLTAPRTRAARVPGPANAVGPVDPSRPIAPSRQPLAQSASRSLTTAAPPPSTPPDARSPSPSSRATPAPPAAATGAAAALPVCLPISPTAAGPLAQSSSGPATSGGGGLGRARRAPLLRAPPRLQPVLYDGRVAVVHVKVYLAHLQALVPLGLVALPAATPAAIAVRPAIAAAVRGVAAALVAAGTRVVPRQPPPRSGLRSYPSHAPDVAGGDGGGGAAAASAVGTTTSGSEDAGRQSSSGPRGRHDRGDRGGEGANGVVGDLAGDPRSVATLPSQRPWHDRQLAVGGPGAVLRAAAPRRAAPWPPPGAVVVAPPPRSPLLLLCHLDDPSADPSGGGLRPGAPPPLPDPFFDPPPIPAVPPGPPSSGGVGSGGGGGGPTPGSAAVAADDVVSGAAALLAQQAGAAAAARAAAAGRARRAPLPPHRAAYVPSGASSGGDGGPSPVSPALPPQSQGGAAAEVFGFGDSGAEGGALGAYLAFGPAYGYHAAAEWVEQDGAVDNNGATAKSPDRQRERDKERDRERDKQAEDRDRERERERERGPLSHRGLLALSVAAAGYAPHHPSSVPPGSVYSGNTSTPASVASPQPFPTPLAVPRAGAGAPRAAGDVSGGGGTGSGGAVGGGADSFGGHPDGARETTGADAAAAATILALAADSVLVRAIAAGYAAAAAAAPPVGAPGGAGRSAYVGARGGVTVRGPGGERLIGVGPGYPQGVGCVVRDGRDSVYQILGAPLVPLVAGVSLRENGVPDGATLIVQVGAPHPNPRGVVPPPVPRPPPLPPLPPLPSLPAAPPLAPPSMAVLAVPAHSSSHPSRAVPPAAGAAPLAPASPLVPAAAFSFPTASATTATDVEAAAATAAAAAGAATVAAAAAAAAGGLPGAAPTLLPAAVAGHAALLATLAAAVAVAAVPEAVARAAAVGTPRAVAATADAAGASGVAVGASGGGAAGAAASGSGAAATSLVPTAPPTTAAAAAAIAGSAAISRSATPSRTPTAGDVASTAAAMTAAPLSTAAPAPGPPGAAAAPATTNGAGVASASAAPSSSLPSLGALSGVIVDPYPVRPVFPTAVRRLVGPAGVPALAAAAAVAAAGAALTVVPLLDAHRPLLGDWAGRGLDYGAMSSEATDTVTVTFVPITRRPDNVAAPAHVLAAPRPPPIAAPAAAAGPATAGGGGVGVATATATGSVARPRLAARSAPVRRAVVAAGGAGGFAALLAPHPASGPPIAPIVDTSLGDPAAAAAAAVAAAAAAAAAAGASGGGPSSGRGASGSVTAASGGAPAAGERTAGGPAVAVAMPSSTRVPFPLAGLRPLRLPRPVAAHAFAAACGAENDDGDAAGRRADATDPGTQPIVSSPGQRPAAHGRALHRGGDVPPLPLVAAPAAALAASPAAATASSRFDFHVLPFAFRVELPRCVPLLWVQRLVARVCGLPGRAFERILFTPYSLETDGPGYAPTNHLRAAMPLGGESSESDCSGHDAGGSGSESDGGSGAEGGTPAATTVAMAADCGSAPQPGTSAASTRPAVGPSGGASGPRRPRRSSAGSSAAPRRPTARRAATRQRRRMVAALAGHTIDPFLVGAGRRTVFFELAGVSVGVLAAQQFLRLDVLLPPPPASAAHPAATTTAPSSYPAPHPTGAHPAAAAPPSNGPAVAPPPLPVWAALRGGSVSGAVVWVPGDALLDRAARPGGPGGFGDSGGSGGDVGGGGGGDGRGPAAPPEPGRLSAAAAAAAAAIEASAMTTTTPAAASVGGAAGAVSPCSPAAPTASASAGDGESFGPVVAAPRRAPPALSPAPLGAAAPAVPLPPSWPAAVAIVAGRGVFEPAAAAVAGGPAGESCVPRTITSRPAPSLLPMCHAPSPPLVPLSAAAAAWPGGAGDPSGHLAVHSPRAVPAAAAAATAAAGSRGSNHPTSEDDAAAADGRGGGSSGRPGAAAATPGLTSAVASASASALPTARLASVPGRAAGGDLAVLPHPVGGVYSAAALARGAWAEPLIPAATVMRRLAATAARMATEGDAAARTAVDAGAARQHSGDGQQSTAPHSTAPHPAVSASRWHAALLAAAATAAVWPAPLLGAPPPLPAGITGPAAAAPGGPTVASAAPPAPPHPPTPSSHAHAHAHAQPGARAGAERGSDAAAADLEGVAGPGGGGSATQGSAGSMAMGGGESTGESGRPSGGRWECRDAASFFSVASFLPVASGVAVPADAAAVLEHARTTAPLAGDLTARPSAESGANQVADVVPASGSAVLRMGVEVTDGSGTTPTTGGAADGSAAGVDGPLPSDGNTEMATVTTAAVADGSAARAAAAARAADATAGAAAAVTASGCPALPRPTARPSCAAADDRRGVGGHGSGLPVAGGEAAAVAGGDDHRRDRDRDRSGGALPHAGGAAVGSGGVAATAAAVCAGGGSAATGSAVDAGSATDPGAIGGPWAGAVRALCLLDLCGLSAGCVPNRVLYVPAAPPRVTWCLDAADAAVPPSPRLPGAASLAASTSTVPAATPASAIAHGGVTLAHTPATGAAPRAVAASSLDAPVDGLPAHSGGAARTSGGVGDGCGGSAGGRGGGDGGGTARRYTGADSDGVVSISSSVPDDVFLCALAEPDDVLPVPPRHMAAAHFGPMSTSQTTPRTAATSARDGGTGIPSVASRYVVNSRGVGPGGDARVAADGSRPAQGTALSAAEAARAAAAPRGDAAHGPSQPQTQLAPSNPWRADAAAPTPSAATAGIAGRGGSGGGSGGAGHGALGGTGGGGGGAAADVDAFALPPWGFESGRIGDFGGPSTVFTRPPVPPALQRCLAIPTPLPSDLLLIPSDVVVPRGSFPEATPAASHATYGAFLSPPVPCSAACAAAAARGDGACCCAPPLGRVPDVAPARDGRDRDRDRDRDGSGAGHGGRGAPRGAPPSTPARDGGSGDGLGSGRDGARDAAWRDAAPSPVPPAPSLTPPTHRRAAGAAQQLFPPARSGVAGGEGTESAAGVLGRSASVAVAAAAGRQGSGAGGGGSAVGEVSTCSLPSGRVGGAYGGPGGACAVTADAEGVTDPIPSGTVPWWRRPPAVPPLAVLSPATALPLGSDGAAAALTVVRAQNIAAPALVPVAASVSASRHDSRPTTPACSPTAPAAPSLPTSPLSIVASAADAAEAPGASTTAESSTQGAVGTGAQGGGGGAGGPGTATTTEPWPWAASDGGGGGESGGRASRSVCTRPIGPPLLWPPRPADVFAVAVCRYVEYLIPDTALPGAAASPTGCLVAAAAAAAAAAANPAAVESGMAAGGACGSGFARRDIAVRPFGQPLLVVLRRCDVSATALLRCLAAFRAHDVAMALARGESAEDEAAEYSVAGGITVGPGMECDDPTAAAAEGGTAVESDAAWPYVPGLPMVAEEAALAACTLAVCGGKPTAGPFSDVYCQEIPPRQEVLAALTTRTVRYERTWPPGRFGRNVILPASFPRCLYHNGLPSHGSPSRARSHSRFLRCASRSGAPSAHREGAVASSSAPRNEPVPHRVVRRGRALVWGEDNRDAACIHPSQGTC